MPEYEYRVLSRSVGSDSGWFVVHTNRSAGRPFRTLSAARGQVTRERKADERRQWRTGIRYPAPAREYKIQRRPVSTDWEDVA